MNRAAPPVLISAPSAGEVALPGAAGAFPPQTGGLSLPPLPRFRPPPSPATAACNKSSTAVDCWHPTPSLRSRSGWERALAHVRQARRARPIFPGFSGLKSKKGPPGACSGCFPFFEGYFPTCCVDLANFPLVIGNTSSRTPIFLYYSPPDAISPPQRGREPR